MSELIAQAEALSSVIDSVENCPILYSDTIRSRRVNRDDLWAITTEQLLYLRQLVRLFRAFAEQPAEQGEPVAHLVIIKTADAGETKFFTAPSDPRGFPVYRDSKASLRQVQKLLRGLSFKDAKITQALECIHRALEGDDQDPRLAALEGLLREAFLELRHAKIFTTSREKMHPTGQELYDRLVERIEAALGGK